MELIFERLPYRFARWVKGTIEDPARLQQGGRTLCVKDDEDQLLVLFDSEFYMQHLIQQNPELTFVKQSD
ncbi:hypothetical protein SAMN06264849_103256 [Melghirimyces algeriensis]|uniref:Uncharacterized protein n=1 Tax=Melghirimyces algeriensis TaxID=910412 RepID=A0A521CBY6_9BACL|nr:hypothetical protein SAMN06264849_103256 [Melghirimyces algeriensis]